MHLYMNGATINTGAFLNEATEWGWEVGDVHSNDVCKGSFDLKSERGQWDFHQF